MWSANLLRSLNEKGCDSAYETTSSPSKERTSAPQSARKSISLLAESRSLSDNPVANEELKKK